jgi:hypothetical protein
MPPREPVRPAESALRCDHCGRPVSETRHTRTSYAVDYYSVHSGHGEVCSFTTDDGQRGGAYVKLLDRFDVITCVQCYGQPSVRAERERCFRPERPAPSAAVQPGDA